MAKRDDYTDEADSRIVSGAFRRDLKARRPVTLELPEFLLCALEARVAESNADAEPTERATLDHYIETELVNLVTLRDVAELEFHIPGFAQAVHQWIIDMRE